MANHNSVSPCRTALLPFLLLLLLLLDGVPLVHSSDSATPFRRDEAKTTSAFTTANGHRTFMGYTFSTTAEDGRSSSTSSASLLRETETILRRNHQQQNLGQQGRDLIYKGNPTGGNKYKSLVSMWLGTMWSSAGPDALNATLLTPNVCHGVMVSDDVFVTHRACAAAISVFPVVMIGDYDSTLPHLEDSVQLREVGFVAVSIEHLPLDVADPMVTLDPSNLAVGVLTQPVTLPGFVPSTMNDDPDVPLPYDNLTVVGYGGDPAPTGINLMSWPGPALEAEMNATDATSCLVFAWLLGIPTFVESALLCAFAVAPYEAYPCQDDLGGPVFDVNQKLMGFTYLTGCQYQFPATRFLKSSYFKNDVIAVACQISSSNTLPFACPDYTCPVDTIRLGYPWAELPDVRPMTNARNGFVPTTVSQYPPPGTIVRFNTTTDIRVNARDATTNETRSCATRILVPELIPCGTVEMNNLTIGSYLRVGTFQPNRTIVSGTVFKMRGVLQDALSGRGSVRARLRKGSSRYRGEVVFTGNQTKGALNNLMITEPFSFLNASESLVVDVEVKNNTNPQKNVARYVVYCQEVFAAHENNNNNGGGDGGGDPDDF